MSAIRGLTLVDPVRLRTLDVGRLGYWGFTMGEGALAFPLGIVAPALAAVVWGLFVAPKARHPVPIGVRLCVEFVVFAAAVLALVATGHPVLAATLAVLAATTSALNAMQERNGQPSGHVG